MPRVDSRPAPTTSVRSGGTTSRSHSIHDAHIGFGTDPSSRPASEQDGLDPLAEKLSEDAKAIRSMLSSQGRHALRQAVILHEVLGPPAAMRDEPA